MGVGDEEDMLPIHPEHNYNSQPHPVTLSTSTPTLIYTSITPPQHPYMLALLCFILGQQNPL